MTFAHNYEIMVVRFLNPFMFLYLKKPFLGAPSLDVILIYLYYYFSDISIEGHGCFLYLTLFSAWPYLPYLPTTLLSYTLSQEEE